MAQRLPGEAEITFILVSALAGSNVVNRAEQTAWYQGPTLLEHLETVPIARGGHLNDVFFPVQYVLRPNLISAVTVAPGRWDPQAGPSHSGLAKWADRRNRQHPHP